MSFIQHQDSIWFRTLPPFEIVFAQASRSLGRCPCVHFAFANRAHARTRFRRVVPAGKVLTCLAARAKRVTVLLLANPAPSARSPLF